MQHKMERLQTMGFKNLGTLYWNLPTTALYEEAIRRREGLIAHLGPLVVRTGHYTGRSPLDKFLVKEKGSQDQIWWGEANQPFALEKYKRMRSRVMAYLQGRDLYIQELFVGANPQYQIPVQVITESAWHAMFARNMFIREVDWEKLETFNPAYTLIHVPHFHAIPEVDGTRSEVLIIVNFGSKEILIGGTSYAGEIKKSVFTVMNYLLPLEGVLSMHCSANYGDNSQDVALFFGLSGTGKTTLSVESGRTLIGDDEHGWSEQGIFNLEGGCYAKVISISSEDEPEIYAITRRFGTILENVSIDLRSRRIDLDDASLTENTRAAFPIQHLENASRLGMAGHPRQIFFLTADAFGVLPPIARLTPEQAQYYFLLGYTAKVAGTERGLKEPKATFSPCFGAPFMVHSPEVYAKLLREKIQKHRVEIWLVNTGWTGGAYGEGHRIKLPYTRAMIRAALKGQLEKTELKPDPFFGLAVPQEVPDIPPEILHPCATWKNGQSYDQKARELIGEFREAFEQFEAKVSKEVRDSGPKNK